KSFIAEVKTEGSTVITKEDKRLSVDPEEGHFLEAGGKQDFMLVNTTYTPIAVKIKCSNNAQYKVMPVYLAIDKGQISTLTVTRASGPAKNDKLVAAYCPMEGVKDPKEAIAKYESKGKKCQIIRIMLKVVNAEDFAVPDPSREAVS
ncbi:hypothetical protein PMAYCL1PPCAC_12670, partial [Pristionchus mayeri]